MQSGSRLTFPMETINALTLSPTGHSRFNIKILNNSSNSRTKVNIENSIKMHYKEDNRIAFIGLIRACIAKPLAPFFLHNPDLEM